MVDIGRALKVAESTGKVVFGEKETEKAVSEGQALMVITAKNCKSEVLNSDLGMRVHRYKGNNMELGAVAGKPFSVSALAVLDKGNSNILQLG